MLINKRFPIIFEHRNFLLSQTLYSLIHSSFLFVSFSLSRTLVYCVWYVLPVLHLMLMLLLLSRHVERHGTVPISALLCFALLKQTLCFSFRWLDLTWLDYPSLNKTDFCSFSFSLSFCSFSSRPVDFASCFSRLSITTLHS